MVAVIIFLAASLITYFVMKNAFGEDKGYEDKFVSL